MQQNIIYIHKVKWIYVTVPVIAVRFACSNMLLDEVSLYWSSVKCLFWLTVLSAPP